MSKSIKDNSKYVRKPKPSGEQCEHGTAIEKSCYLCISYAIMNVKLK